MKKLVLLAIIAVSFSACQSSMSVVSDSDKSVDFNKYRTFQLLPWPEELNNLVSRNSQLLVDKSIKETLTRYGYTLVDKNADLVVSTYIHIDEEKGVTAYNNYYGSSYGYGGGFGYGYGYGYGGYGGGVSTTTYQEYSYEVGSLILDVYDQAEKKLVWQGIGTDQLSDNIKKTQNKIPSYVRQVLYDFPKVDAK
jgi:hypothetical protein